MTSQMMSAPKGSQCWHQLVGRHGVKGGAEVEGHEANDLAFRCSRQPARLRVSQR
jgi:hypothetical protein